MMVFLTAMLRTKISHSVVNAVAAIVFRRRAAGLGLDVLGFPFAPVWWKYGIDTDQDFSCTTTQIFWN